MGSQSNCAEIEQEPPYVDILEDLNKHDPVYPGEMPLDPGIRDYVLILRAQGVETFESCDGGEGQAFPEPTIRFDGNAWEGFRAFTAAMNYGLPVTALRRSYGLTDGELQGPWWEMTFRTTGKAG